VDETLMCSFQVNLMDFYLSCALYKLLKHWILIKHFWTRVVYGKVIPCGWSNLYEGWFNIVRSLHLTGVISGYQNYFCVYYTGEHFNNIESVCAAGVVCMSWISWQNKIFYGCNSKITNFIYRYLNPQTKRNFHMED
jgi:hypothetical protein